ncbi:uncharacterized protein V6R79_007081 [Siganus canaliculatus]
MDRKQRIDPNRNKKLTEDLDQQLQVTDSVVITYRVCGVSADTRPSTHTTTQVTVLTFDDGSMNSAPTGDVRELRDAVSLSGMLVQPWFDPG